MMMMSFGPTILVLGVTILLPSVSHSQGAGKTETLPSFSFLPVPNPLSPLLIYTQVHSSATPAVESTSWTKHPNSAQDAPDGASSGTDSMTMRTPRNTMWQWQIPARGGELRSTVSSSPRLKSLQSS